ncbi:MAG: type II secretion system F family protein [Alphaproteobacteria bacterium]|nr:type II secretion system F family protein [Alphaproteobacteria bacterium]
MDFIFLLLDLEILFTFALSVAVFIVIYILIFPFFQNDNRAARLKLISSERKVIRQRERERTNPSENRISTLRKKEPGYYIRRVVESFDLLNFLDPVAAKLLLSSAGYRGQRAVFTFIFLRFCLPFVFFLFALFYAFVLNDFKEITQQNLLLMSLGFGLLGFFAPNLWVANQANKRNAEIRKFFPDALDLLLICIESGMSIDASLQKVSEEIFVQSMILAEEIALTMAELSYLEERSQAYVNMGQRVGLDIVKNFSSTLTQAEKYGTPIAQALKTMSHENRILQMQAAEKKAAALPPKLTVPMILFFLPVIFIVVLSPAVIQMGDAFGSAEGLSFGK